MKNRKSYREILIVVVGFFCFQLTSIANDDNLSRVDYIDLWKEEAIYQMVVHKIPASITLAQGILESGNGNSTLAKNANNHFGIKCHSSWEGAKVYHDDDAKGECFRSYSSAGQSYEDHSIFLKQNRYMGLYDLKITDYKAWAKGLKKAGYATDSKYSKRLIDLIEQNDLTKYDKEGLKMIKDGVVPKHQNNSKNDNSDELDDYVNNHDRPDLSDNDSEEGLPEVSLFRSRIFNKSSNNIPYIIVEKDEDFDALAKSLDMMPWQLWKYNDLKKGDKITEGQHLYIKPKRAKAKADFHIVQEGEDLWEVSQIHGVKLKKLAKKNGLSATDDLEVGKKLYLRKKKG